MTEARDREPLLPGHAYIAPAGAHLEFFGQGSLCRRGVASPAGRSPRAVGGSTLPQRGPGGGATVAVILTGMGNDGREGIVACAKAGGRTLAESKETAVVFGMPREAAESGAVDEVVALSEMPRTISRRRRWETEPGVAA